MSSHQRPTRHRSTGGKPPRRQLASRSIARKTTAQQALDGDSDDSETENLSGGASSSHRSMGGEPPRHKLATRSVAHKTISYQAQDDESGSDMESSNGGARSSYHAPSTSRRSTGGEPSTLQLASRSSIARKITAQQVRDDGDTDMDNLTGGASSSRRSVGGKSPRRLLATRTAHKSTAHQAQDDESSDSETSSRRASSSHHRPSTGHRLTGGSPPRHQLVTSSSIARKITAHTLNSEDSDTENRNRRERPVDPAIYGISPIIGYLNPLAPPYAQHAVAAPMARPSQGSHLTMSTSPFEKQTFEAMPRSLPSKAIQPLLPRWQASDETYEAILTPQRRKMDEDLRFIDLRDAIRRMPTSAAARTGSRHRILTRNVKEARAEAIVPLPKGHIGPNLRLHVEGWSDSDSDNARGLRPTNTFATQQARKQHSSRAARKGSAYPSDDERSSSASDSDTHETSSSSPSKEEQVQRPPDTDGEGALSEDGDFTEAFYGRHPSSSLPPLDYATPRPEIPNILNLASQLPAATQSNHQPAKQDAPPDELVAAVEALTLSTLKVQQVHRLPFLRRNLRLGFRSRCTQLGIDTHVLPGAISVLVRYTLQPPTGPQKLYEAKMEMWLCPLCQLHGAFDSRAMLTKHLRWDHPEVECNWQKLRSQAIRHAWELTIRVPDPKALALRRSDIAQLHPSFIPLQVAPSLNVQQEVEVAQLPSLAPPEPALAQPPTFPTKSQVQAHESVELTIQEIPTKKTPGLAIKLEPNKNEDILFGPPSIPSTSTEVPTESQSTVIPYIRRSESRFPSPERPLPVLPAPVSMKLPSPMHTDVTQPRRYPTPPPISNPLGPAAVPPYLPAVSEYGGPTVTYSVRPTGPCLFDLLRTLPMQEYGVLSWVVIEREEEIFESDDVLEEHKVMHALWARWMILNRRKFVANYYKGVLEFIHYYWKMIHRAAGWAALRYWLLLLVANRYLTGHQVPMILKEYEELVGMENWYK